MLKIVRADSDDHFKQAHALFKEYAALLGIDLSFQRFDEELLNLATVYSLPNGSLLLAFYRNQTSGCVALRELENGICEMKRLYVKPEFRNLRIGDSLAREIIDEGRRLGYSRMRLDTLPSMVRAQALYKSLGFREIAPYRFNPVDGTLFMELAI